MANSRRLHAVFLDLDDTLCDTEGLTPSRMEAVREALAGQVAAEDLAAVVAEAVGWDPVGTPGGQANRLQRIGDRLGLSEEQRQKMRAAYNRVLVENLSLFEGVTEVLAWLRERIALGLITNGPSEFQRGKIARLGIAEYFDSIIVSGEVGHHKPAPEVFHAALHSLSAEPEEAIYVGDRPEADIAGAHAVGITSVLLRRNYAYPMREGPEADYTLDNVNGLPDFLTSKGWVNGDAGRR